MTYDDWKLAHPPEYDESSDDDTPECLGHDSTACGDYDGYPRTVYCDGSCRLPLRAPDPDDDTPLCNCGTCTPPDFTCIRED